MTITPPTIPAPPPGGVSLPLPAELHNIADCVRYGLLDSAACRIIQSITPHKPHIHQYGDVFQQRFREAAQREHDDYCRAIVPYEHHRELRRLAKIKRTLHKKHPHFFYRYSDQRGKGARPVKNWLLVEMKHKTDGNDGSSYQPCGAVPLPAPQIAGLLPERVPSKPIVQWIPVPAMRDELPVPAGAEPKRIGDKLVYACESCGKDDAFNLQYMISLTRGRREHMAVCRCGKCYYRESSQYQKAKLAAWNNRVRKAQEMP